MFRHQMCHPQGAYLAKLRKYNCSKCCSCTYVIYAMTRIAQIPSSSWLPAAMAAPTPVSGLVHSSTLITAVVYLLIRFSSSFGLWLNIFLLLISGLTIFMAGLGANFEYDVKRIIASSTLRQLGLVIMTISIGLSGLAFFSFC